MITIKAPPATASLGLRKIHTFPQNLHRKPTNYQTSPFTSILHPNSNPNPPRTLKISCNKEKENITDEILSLELGLEIKKLSTQIVQREDALKKSRELLFTEVCNFVGLKSEDLRKKWKRMEEKEKWDLIEGFVAEWSAHFHPLSVRSVKEMVEQYLGQDNVEISDSVSLFPDFRKFLDFS